jgi:hypothetical protein
MGTGYFTDAANQSAGEQLQGKEQEWR